MKEEARTGQPVVIGELTITAIERVRVYCGASGVGIWVYAHKEPVSVVIDSPNGQRKIELTIQEPEGRQVIHPEDDPLGSSA
ncbi:MAG: hypothetical protein BZY87_08250 [SAR202 cluster bacterium Io17-Chloro-G6]|nr:MAG: hypothetical protein BZY87_08250 [SAR202 cluster bacterium Io17-Chloro-G6]